MKYAIMVVWFSTVNILAISAPLPCWPGGGGGWGAGGNYAAEFFSLRIFIILNIWNQTVGPVIMSPGPIRSLPLVSSWLVD